jgi:hypothetical protein
MTDFMPATVEPVRSTLLDRRLIAAGALDSTLASCRARLSDLGL